MRNPLALFGKRARASRANERARELDRLGQTTEAIDEYERACQLDPEWSVPAYNLGLIYKYAGDWERSLAHNLRATVLDPKDQAGWWNLGIAATALGRWEVARSAWRGAGIDVPPGDGPVDYPCGNVPVRLNPNGAAEVVWSDRIDPVRAVVRSIPFPESGFRFGDLVLHDGAGTGWRKRGDREVPVFNCLELLCASRFSTWVAEVDLDETLPAGAEAIELLQKLALDRDLSVEDWTTSIEILCKACSEGKPYLGHDHPQAPVGSRRRLAIAAADGERVRRLLDEWRGRVSHAKVLELDLALDAAGQDVPI